MAEPLVENIVYMSPSKLREKFNGSQYPELIKEHKLTKEVVKSNPLNAKALLEKGFSAGTKSETIIYHDSVSKKLYVKIHQYVLPSGRLGGSGNPDPKAMLLDGTMYCFASPGSKFLHQT